MNAACDAFVLATYAPYLPSQAIHDIAHVVRGVDRRLAAIEEPRQQPGAAA